MSKTIVKMSQKNSSNEAKIFQMSQIIVQKWAKKHSSNEQKIDQMNKIYSETLNNECIERIPQMSYSTLSDNGMLQIFSF